MTCEPCSVSIEFPDHPMHNPVCPFCGARLLQAIARTEQNPARRRTRQTWVLDHWQSHGHDRARIRAMAMAGEVNGQAKTTGSDAHRATKQRSRGRRSGSESPPAP